MSWFSVEPEKRLFCETCKAHIEMATFTGTVMEEGINRLTGIGTGFYGVKRLSFCAKCKPEHDIVIMRRDRIEHITLNTSTRTLTDPVSKQQAAQRTADAVIEALAAAAEALGEGDAKALDEAQVEADRARTVATEVASAGEFPAQPMPAQPRDPIA